MVAFGLIWPAFTCQAQTNYDFNYQVSSSLYTLGVQPDGKMLYGAIKGPLRLEANGTPDPSFAPGLSILDSVLTLAVQADGKILVGGHFNQLAGQPRTNLGRFEANGSLDATFQSHLDRSGSVYALALQADGKILVGGFFKTASGQTNQSLARLNTNGIPDDTFHSPINGILFSVAVQRDGQILVGGSFETSGSVVRTNLARLNSDGSVDATFAAPLTSEVECFAGQPDGKILAGTRLSTSSNQNTYLARFNADGSLDTNFNASVNGGVVSIALQADGKILVGGTFDNLGGQTRKGLGRLNPDGSLDAGFVLPDYTRVYSLGLQDNGAILVGGFQIDPGPQTNSHAGRLPGYNTASQTLTFDGMTVTWLRGGSAPEIWNADFEQSVDGVNWINLGTGTRIPGGWRLSGVTVPQFSYIRARGRVSVGQFNGPSWFSQSIIRISLPPKILVDDGKFGFRSNQFGFSYTGQSNNVIVVEGSTDLQTWTALTTNTLESQSAYFRDASGVGTRRFYRLRLLTQ